MVEKITIQPGKIRAYGNIINNKTTEDYDRYESSLVKSLVTINGVPIQSYLLVYSPNNFAFDFDGNLKHLYVSEDEDTVDGFTFDSDNKELSFSSDDVSFGFDDINKRLYCDNEYHPTSYTVSLNVSSSSVSVGGSVTLSATVLDDQETAVEGATVTFKVGGSTIDTATTNSSGVATLSYTCNTVGSLSFTASCNGANSTSQSVTVNKLSTSTALTTSSASVTVGTSVTFTATVTSGGTGVNGLTVTFKDGTSTLGTGTTNSSGVATYTTDSLTEGTHSITAVVTETSTYSTSTSTAVTVTVNNHSYSLAFSAASYVATGGSATLSVTLLDNNVPVEGATISVSGSDSSLYSGLTNSSGIATITVTGITSNTTFTATYSNVSDTCTVTAQSYIINDDASVNNRDTLFGSSSIALRNNGTSTMTWTSASPSYYQVKVTKSSSDSFIEYLPLRGVTDSFKLTMKFKLPSTSGVSYVGLYYYIDSNNWGGVKSLSDAQWVSSKTNGTFTEQEYRTGKSLTTNYYTNEISYNKTANTLTIDTYDDSNVLIQSKTMNIPITLTSSVKWGNAAAWGNGDKNNIYLIKAEYI